MSIKPQCIRGFLESSQEACLNPEYRFKRTTLIPLPDSLVHTAGCLLELASAVEKFLHYAVVEEAHREPGMECEAL